MRPGGPGVHTDYTCDWLRHCPCVTVKAVFSANASKFLLQRWEKRETEAHSMMGSVLIVRSIG